MNVCIMFPKSFRKFHLFLKFLDPRLCHIRLAPESDKAACYHSLTINTQ